MFIDYGHPLFGAPAERNVLVDEYVDLYTRYVGTKSLIDGRRL